MYTRIRGSGLEQGLRRDLEDVLRRRLDAVNRTWASGVFDPESEPVTEDFVGIQPAPWYPGGEFRTDASAWREGNRQAAAAGLGGGWRRSAGAVRCCRGSADEATAVFTVVHRCGKEPVPPAEAVSLQTRVRQEGRRLLRRHTAEKR